MRWLGRRIHDLAALRRAIRHYNLNPLAALTEYLRLTIGEHYSPTEVINLGLLDPQSPVRPDRYISSEKLLGLQRQLNPAQYHRWTEDKVTFLAKCRDAALPTPQVFATFSRNTCDARIECSRVIDQLAPGYLAHPTGFVVKPVHGVHGSDVLLLERRGNEMRDSSGSRVTTIDLANHIAESSYDEWMVQERLRPHPALAELSGLPLIQTVRIVTYVTRNGEIEIPFAWLRIVGSPKGVDNFSFGRNGNLVATLDAQTGVIQHVLGGDSAGFGLELVTEHPLSGMKFAGFSIPEFAAACSTAKRAAAAFSPLRTIGWDVAITDQGISLIEGNVTWDPLPTCSDLARVIHAFN